jgi:hypothetical protein
VRMEEMFDALRKWLPEKTPASDCQPV